ncbi:MAG: GTP-binding protein [Bacteroidota bacterium]
MSTIEATAIKPTTILTGYLGAGKTTFLNHLMTNKPNTRYAIIENEFGQQGIDSELIIRPEANIMEINNGCLCCTLNENLFEILDLLFDKRAEYDEIIIEATGVANPNGLAAPFVSHPSIKKHFPLSRIICLVDAELIEQQLVETEEAIHQITYSDLIIINKTDLVDQAHLDALAQKLQALNPLGKIVFGNKDDFPTILQPEDAPLFNELYLKEQTESAAKKALEDLKINEALPHHPHKHTETVKSLTFRFDRDFSYKMLYHQLFAYLTFQSRGLYRMKGKVWIEGKDKPLIIQSVGSRLDFQEGTPSAQSSPRESKIIFIGKGLRREGLDRLLNTCFA